MAFRRSRQPKPWRSVDQKMQRSYNGRKETLIKLVMAINKLPNTRFGLYGEHNGKWLKLEPDESFSHDTGATIQVHEKYGPDSAPLLTNVPPPSVHPQPDTMINLAGDIFNDALTYV